MSKPENQRFPVRKLATSHCTDCRKQKRVRPKYFIKDYEKAYRTGCRAVRVSDTHGRVYSHRLSY